MVIPAAFVLLSGICKLRGRAESLPLEERLGDETEFPSSVLSLILLCDRN